MMYGPRRLLPLLPPLPPLRGGRLLDGQQPVPQRLFGAFFIALGLLATGYARAMPKRASSGGFSTPYTLFQSPNPEG